MKLWCVDDGGNEEKDGEEEEEELGGLFKVIKKAAAKGKSQRYNANLMDCSCFNVEMSHDWEIEEVKTEIKK